MSFALQYTIIGVILAAIAIWLVRKMVRAAKKGDMCSSGCSDCPITDNCQELRNKGAKRKSLPLVLALLMIPAVAQAELVTQKEARDVAQQFFNAYRGEMTAQPKMVYSGRRLTTDRLFNPFYVFNSPVGGYVIVSADNKAYPILAYDFHASFDADKIGPKLKALLTDYALDIEHIRYDDRMPVQAIKAWGDLQGYIAGIVKQPQTSDAPNIGAQDAELAIEGLIRSGEAEMLLSDIYTPEQWVEMVSEPLGVNVDVPVAFVNNDKIESTVVFGREGDYYLMSLDGPNTGRFRLLATEMLTGLQLAAVSNYPEPKLEEEEPAFAFYDNFMAETRAEQAAEEARIANVLIPSDPVVYSHGSGHYTIFMPKEISMARIFNMSGSLIRQHTYGNTDAANIDISYVPNGFYVIQIITDDGESYGFKLTR